MKRLDPKTIRAAAVADTSTFVTIAGVGLFLGFPAVPVVVSGAVAGGLMAVLIIAASLRAETFAPTDQTDHLRLGRTQDDEVNRG